MVQHRRVMTVNRYLRGRLGIYKTEYIYEYSPILGNWVGFPRDWYEVKFANS